MLTRDLDETVLTNFDEKKGYPETPARDLLDWRLFNPNVISDEADATSVLAKIVNSEAYASELIDCRPYMIIHPYLVNTHDDLFRCLEMFRHHHLRHLPVVNGIYGSLRGIITRQDMFAYMSL